MRVVAYCRYSSENQRDGYSIEAQKRAIDEYCAKEDHIIIDYYIDEARTGTNDSRDAFQDMINDSAGKHFKAVVVHKLDRFSRERYDSAIYKKKLKDNGVRVISVTEPLDDSPESVMMESVIEGMNEYYSKNLSRECKKGKDERARNGLWNGGIIPYGFNIVNGKYQINEKESKYVQSIFSKFLAGDNAQNIATWMNESGERTRKGQIFKRHSISKILENPHYTGYLHYGRNREKLIKVKITDPIITADMFEAVQSKIKVRKNAPVSRTRESTYLLTGVLYCGECGSHLRGHKSKKKYVNKHGELVYLVYRSYRCTGTAGASRAAHLFDKSVPYCKLKGFSKVKLEAFIINSIHHNVLSDDGIEDIIQKIIKRNKENSLAGKAKAKLKYYENKKDRLLDIYLDGSLDKNIYNTKAAELDEQICLLKTSVSERSILLEDEDYLRKILASLKNDTDSSSFDYRKMLIATFIDSIYIDSQKVIINYKLDIIRSGVFSEELFVPKVSTASAKVYLSTKHPLSLINLVSDPTRHSVGA